MENENMGFGSNWFIVLILFFLAANGGGFGGFGGNYGANFGGVNSPALQGIITRADVQDTINAQNVNNGIVNLNNSINGGFMGVNIGLNNGFNSVNSNIAQLGYQMNSCCCDIKSTILSQVQSVKDIMSGNKITDLQNEVILSRLAASQFAQTDALKDYIDAKVTPPATATA